MSDAPVLEIEIEASPEGEEAEEGADTRRSAPPSRDRDLLGRKNSPIRKRLSEIFQAVKTGFDNQAERADSIMDYWDCYNCVLNSNQFYSGDAAIYVPIIHDAVEARTTRFANQLFPQSGRYVEAVTADSRLRAELQALIEHYIRARRFKTQIVEPLITNGDVEGQYTLYADWAEVERQIVSRETRGPIDPETGAEVPGDEIEDVVEETIREGMPVFEVLHDADVLVCPPTVDSVEEALSTGGCVAIVRRWTKTKIDQMIGSGAIRADEGKHLKDTMGQVSQSQENPEKALAEHVGIIEKGEAAVCWEVWANLELDEDGNFDEDGRPRLCRIFYGPEQAALGCKRNPYWNDRCPLGSWPVKKIAGVFKGESKVAPVASLQYEANDAVNEGADAATYAAMPLVARDPEKGNGPLIAAPAAVWDIAPGSVELLTFPDLTPRAQIRVGAAISQIFQTLSVSPAMLPQQTRMDKPNQAQIAQEQAVDLLTTATAVTVVEEGPLNWAVSWMLDLDYQFRDSDLVVRMFGEMGHEAQMQVVAPLQNRHGVTFYWRGGEQMRQNAMMMQQGTGWLNVLRGLRQDLAAEGIQLRLAPLIEAGTIGIYGPVLGSRVIIDQREQLTIPAESENGMLIDGFEVPVHPLDEDQQHMQVHHQAFRETGDPQGTIRAHLAAHMAQARAKTQAVMMRQMQQQMQAQGGGPPGMPPGGPRPPQGGMMPRQGAQPAGPRLVKGPPGAVHPDQMPRMGGVVMPRKM